MKYGYLFQFSKLTRVSSTLATFACALAISPANARPLQIIHTNDLHSHLEKGDTDVTGGYAGVKAVIEQIKAQAQQAGIDTLVLDGGDFSEGNAFFFADEGKQSFRMMDSMGYDAIALGNHDWLIGTQQLNDVLGAVNMQTPILAANLFVSSNFEQIRNHILPNVELDRAGVKIGILGLTTDEFVYRWRVQNGNLSDPILAAREQLDDLRMRDDFVIALTHLGTDVDFDLVSKTGGIDLVVGGHSHTTLVTPLISIDQRGVQVPIVQTGQHGEFVGDLLVDVERGKPLQVLRYELHPVSNQENQDRKIASMVTEARTQLEDRYTPNALYEFVGFSEIPLERPLYAPTAWGDFCAEALQETGQADFSFDVGEFYGNSLPAGPLFHESIIQSYPRSFNVHKATGWNVWTMKVPGWLIEIIFNEVVKMGVFINSSGVTYNVTTDDQGNSAVSGVRIQGEPVKIFKEYTVAVSEGIGLGALEISFLLRAFFDPIDTGVPIWSAIEGKIARSNGLIQAPARSPAR